MNIEDSYVNGAVYFQGDKETLSLILSSSGIANEVGSWAIRFSDCDARFKIIYVGNVTPEQPYEVEADGYDIGISVVSQWCEKLAEVLKANSINFNMTHFSGEGEELKNYKA